LRWSARTTGLLSTVALLLLLFNEDGRVGGHGWGKWLGLLFFPFGVMLGLALAWRREALGAAVAAASLVAFYVSQVLFASFPGGPWFLIFTAPAVLFFASWLVHSDTWRHAQNFLLVVSATALGASLFAVGLFCFLVAAEKWKWPIPIGASGPGAGGVIIILLVWAAVLGAIVGFITGIRRIKKRGLGIWKPRVWSGIGLGIVLGLATRILPGGPESIFKNWPTTVVLTAALGMLGGIFATLAGRLWDRRHGGEQRPKALTGP
jgi:hypothetical protein